MERFRALLSVIYDLYVLCWSTIGCELTFAGVLAFLFPTGHCSSKRTTPRQLISTDL